MRETSYSRKEANSIIKEVRKASYNLSRALDNQTWTTYWSNLVDSENKQERQHRQSAPYGTSWTCSSTDASKLLCMQNIIKYTLGLTSYYPNVDDYLHVKKTRFEALALALEYTNDIIDALVDVDVETILNADYCLFN